VIGFNHEHSRHNRDKYVKIISRNIVAGVGHNFERLDYYKDTPYDYYSIMHYAINDYATHSNKKTIEILNPNGIRLNINSIGRRSKLSEDDIAWANKEYGCKGE